VRYDLVLFDADNTLFDYDRAEAFSLRNTLERFGVEHRPEHLRIYRTINKAVWEDLEQGRIDRRDLGTLRFERFFTSIGADPDGAVFGSAYLQALSGASFLIAGAAEVVAGLRGRCRLGLITNGFSSVQHPRLDGSAIADAFDGVFVSEDIGVAKPDRRIFDHALENLGHANRATVLMVGDSLSSDMAGAANAGVDGCWYNPGGLSRDDVAVRWEVRTLAEVVRIVEVAPEGRDAWREA